MAAVNHLNLNDYLGAARSNKRTGRVAILSNRFPTPPGVTDDMWHRVLNVADTMVRREQRRGQHNHRTHSEIQIIKFRRAYCDLVRKLCSATPIGNQKEQALFQTRAFLPQEFFEWALMHGFSINTTGLQWTRTRI